MISPVTSVASNPSARLIANYSQHLSGLFEAVGSADFPTQLIAMLKQLVVINDATIIVYPNTKLPIIDYFDPPEFGGSENLDILVNGAFLIDPYYLATAVDKRHGFFSIKQLAPSGFKKSEYYNSYYRVSGVHDECGYLVPTSGDGFVNISLNKTACSKKFNKKDLQLLEDIYPIIERLSQKHWTSDQSADTASHKNLRLPLQSALDCFGNSVLTDRECQVINKVLCGFSTKAIAEKLSISNETVKLHKKHAYAKLDIKSQSELFHMFLDSLMSTDEYKGGDALTTYLSQQPIANKA